VAARLVIVQTHDELAGALCELLAAEGVEAIRAEDGADAVRLVRMCEPHVVLVDTTLPPLDGWCVLAALGNAVREPGLRSELSVPAANHSHAWPALRLGAGACAADDVQVVAAAGRLLTAIPA